MNYSKRYSLRFFLMIFQTYHKITANSFGSFMIIEYFCSN